MCIQRRLVAGFCCLEKAAGNRLGTNTSSSEEKESIVSYASSGDGEGVHLGVPIVASVSGERRKWRSLSGERSSEEKWRMRISLSSLVMQELGM